jgi:hypothetical protein
MIWFSCNQCGKTHVRPETAAGATIFCECGTGIIVPWESTVTEAAEPAPLPDSPPTLKLEPVTFDPAPGASGPPRASRRAHARRRDPKFCFNHQDVARRAACADCGETFCGDCLVTIATAALCGPCKNFRVKNLQRTAPPSKLSLVSVLIVLLTTPVILSLLPGSRPGFPWWSLVAFLPQGLAGTLAILALREAEKDPHAPGRSLALSGLFGAGLTTILIIILTMYSPQLWT